MELIENKEEKSNAQRSSVGAHFVAFVLIVRGMAYLLRNLGIIESEWVDQFISWQSLIILAGVCAILQRHHRVRVVDHTCYHRHLGKGQLQVFWHRR